ncbi:putative major intrinsic protein [Helianthus annuus]|uniref:Major intrinsic protein n=1 Tax=Helianthus annuus TaxID=4232 RepID=A0A251US94_HELAN|nr:aquaporin NIP6-1 [Helianthus annuus]KAF5806865.1 putative major intrinsic protein [Helianthus annuus]KAJ0585420.1 putative major intrinsic protein [Helianthus annuus]KAJ0919959.1 putative major intrinsic protein [Helianthus annuus]KAJ0923655.1 putative major intrinsic protein [Helianthus annuus]
MDNEDTGSAPSTPVTPGTPGAPLFSGFRPDRNHGSSAFRKSLLGSFKCFSVETMVKEEGTLPTVACLLPPPPISLVRKVGAEFIGTMILIFAGTATAIVNQKTPGSETLIGLAGSSGLAVMIVILSTGHISGAHLNPSITIAFAALRHFPWKHVPLYIGAQVLASICAAFTLKVVFDPMMGGGVTVPSVNYAQAYGLEFIISFNLMFVVTAVATDTRAVGELAGIAVGATVMLNILIAGPVTGGSMNPVRTLGPAIAANNFKGLWIYLTAPILGALAGAGIYTAVKLPEEDANDPNKPRPHSFRR